jgi:hypothetical protein
MQRRDETTYCDFENYVIATTTTRTSDALSGGVFSVGALCEPVRSLPRLMLRPRLNGPDRVSSRVPTDGYFLGGDLRIA